MSIQQWKAELDTANRILRETNERVAELQSKIACAICPLNIGETITIVAKGKEIQGVVENISLATRPQTLPGSETNLEVSWAVGGHRLNRTTGKVGKWSFEINGFDSEFADGKWIYEPPMSSTFGQLCWLAPVDDDLGA